MKAAAVALFFLLFSGLPAQVPPREVRTKLSALEQAYKAGVLTKAEYEKKKAEILASLPKIDGITKKKLEALEAARKAGILTQAEYVKKKALILGSVKPRVSPGGSVGEYRDPAGRFAFRYPTGWEVKPFPNGRGVNVKSGDWALSVLFFSGVADSGKVLSAVHGQVKGQWKDFKVLRRGARKVSGREAQVVEFQGVNPRKVFSRSQLAAFSTGKDTYLLILAAPGAEVEKAGPIWEGFYGSFRLAGNKDPEKRVALRGSLFKHPIGFTFWYPEGWTVLEGGEGGLRLLPPGDKASDPRPRRFVFIIGDSVAGQGIAGPADPRVGAFLDRAVTSMLPLRRIGAATAVGAARGGGAEYNWSGKNLQGETIAARAFATIIKDFGVALLVVGYQKEVRALDGPARKIFASFGFGAGEKDPRLVGSWKMVSTGSIYNKSPFVKSHERAMGYSKTESTLELRADGTWVRTEVSESTFMGAGTSLSSGPRKTVTRGKWSAGKGVLFLMGEDKTWDDCKYRIRSGGEGPLLVLTWEKVRETWRRK